MTHLKYLFAEKRRIRVSVLWLGFFLAASVLCPLHARSQADTDPVISKISIEIHAVWGDKTGWAGLAGVLIFLQEGERFSPAGLRQSIEALEVSKKFQKVHVDSEEEAGHIALFFHLTPFRQIKDIKIDGAFPFFEREILNEMTAHTGDAFIQEELPGQAAMIEKMFQGEGFIAPEVKVTARQDPKDGHFILYVKIDRGPYYSVKGLEIRGSRAFSKIRLKLKMKTWHASLLPGGMGRFIEKKLKEDVENLTGFYRKKVYAEIKIDYALEKNPETKGVFVVATVDEGPRYKVEFRGNRKFRDSALKKEMVFLKEGNKGGPGVKKSMKEIKRRYQKAGYLSAGVKMEDETTTDNKGKKNRLALFVIDEGPCSIVDSIRIRGNHSFDDEKIKKQMLTRPPGFLKKGAFVPERLEEDIYAVKSLYLQHGYMYPEVKEEIKWSEDKRKVVVNLEIREGARTVVSSVRFAGLNLLSEKEAHAAIRLKKGEPFRRHMIKSDENTLSALVSEKGYPHSKVKGELSISEDRAEAGIVYHVDEGPGVEMGQVYCTGNFRTKENILQNELGMKPGDPFSLVKMLEAQRNIRNLDLFNSVRFKTIGLSEKAKKVHLLIEMEEKKPYFIQAGGGYDTQRSFFANARAGDHNLFGRNKDIWVGGNVSRIGFRGESGITEPRFFGSRFTAGFSLFGEQREEFNQDFGTKILGSSLGITGKWRQYFNPGLNFRLEKRDQFKYNSDEADDNDEFKPRKIMVTTPSINYDRRDSFVRPQKGVFSSLSIDISQGLENSLDNFIKYSFEARYYWTPAPRLTFAWHGRLGYIDPFGSSKKVPDDQLFFLGGTPDLRGFKENLLCFDPDGNPVGGRLAISGSVEARIDLGLNFELTGFYDVGKISDTFVESGSGGFRSTAGLGLRYLTPIGPVGFLYGFKLDRKEGESPGRLHFAVGYTF